MGLRADRRCAPSSQASARGLGGKLTSPVAPRFCAMSTPIFRIDELGPRDQRH